MKLLLGLLVSLAISSAFALPARSPKDEVDVVDVGRIPQRSRNNGAADDSDVDTDFTDFKGVVDTGAGYPFLAPLPHPFTFNLGFFDSFEDIFRRLRTRLWSMGSGESSEEGGFSLGLDPTKGANTTSVVKVVDGHKIEINDTVYGNGDGANGAVFKFRVINIRPLESGEELPEGVTEGTPTETQNTPKPRDIEGNSDEDEKKNTSNEDEVKPDDNEINANIDDPESTTEAITTKMHDTVPHRAPSFDNNAVEDDSQDELQVDTDVDLLAANANDDADADVATLAEDDASPPSPSHTMKSEKLSAVVQLENVNEDANDDEDRELNESSVDQEQDSETETDDDEGQRQEQMQELVDMVGEKLSMADDEEERFADEVEKMVSASLDVASSHSLREDVPSSDDEEDNEDANDVSYQGLNSEWGSLDDKNVLTNEIDVYESVPIDLSNDIAINDIMADQGAPVDPDAEVFAVDEFAPMSDRQFEVLRDIK